MLTEHKFLLKVIFLVVMFFIVLNIVLGKTIFLAGENLFSYDYIGHVFNNLTYWPEANLAACKNCPDFYHVSLWYIFVVQVFLSIGQALKFNPFVFDLFTLVLIQVVALYYLFQKISPKFNRFAFIISSTVFITLPHKIYLLPAASKDGIIYGLLTIMFGFAWSTLNNINSFNKKQLLIRGVLLGLILSSSLNIAIAHFPLFFYGYLLIIIIASIRRYQFIPKLIVTIFISALLALILNLPLAISYFSDSQVHILSGYNKLSLIDSLTAGAKSSGSNLGLAKLFFLVVFLLTLILPIRSSRKILLIILYLLCAYVLIGFPIAGLDLYAYLFNYVPFFNHLRGLYRLFYFEIVLITIVIYLGLSKLAVKHNKLLIIFSFILVLYPMSYLTTNSDLFQIGQVPDEYFQTAAYLKQSSDKKIYFPAFASNTSVSISNNYSWLTQTASHPSLYNNPFMSLFIVPNLVHFENINLTPNQAELRSLINFSEAPKNIIAALEYAGIKYLILDRNYLWTKNFPNFNLEELTVGLKLEKQFGNLSIYSLTDNSQKCRPSYGNFSLGHCFSLVQPSNFIDKTPTDFLLDQLSRSGSEFLMEKRKDPPVPNYVSSPIIRNFIVTKKILIPTREIFTAENEVSNLFIKKITPGRYKLFIPILQASHSDRIFRNPTLIIKSNQDVVAQLSPYAASEGLVWTEIDIQTSGESLISLHNHGNGIFVLGRPLLIPDIVWSNLAKNLVEKSSKSTNLKINNLIINSQDIDKGELEIDLLDQKFIAGFHGLVENSDLVEQFPAFTTIEPTELSYNITTDRVIKSLSLTVGSAYLDSVSDGTLLISNKDKSIIYKDTISTINEFIRHIEIPIPDIAGLQEINLTIPISKSQVLLYRLILRINLEN